MEHDCRFNQAALLLPVLSDSGAVVLPAFISSAVTLSTYWPATDGHHHHGLSKSTTEGNEYYKVTIISEANRGKFLHAIASMLMHVSF